MVLNKMIETYTLITERNKVDSNFIHYVERNGEKVVLSSTNVLYREESIIRSHIELMRLGSIRRLETTMEEFS